MYLHGWAWILAAMSALFLYEAGVLLPAGEGLLVAGGRRAGWRVQFGWEGLTLAGRSPWLPNPFTPQRPVYRLRWDEAGERAAGAPEYAASAGAAVALALWALGLLLFAAIPLALYLHLREAPLLVLLALVYAADAAALAALWRVRRRFGLDARAFAGIAFEALACPPFALNLVRRASLRVAPGEDLGAAAHRLQPGAQWSATRAALLTRMDERLAECEAGTPLRLRLERQRERLQEQSMQGDRRQWTQHQAEQRT